MGTWGEAGRDHFAGDDGEGFFGEPSCFPPHFGPVPLSFPPLAFCPLGMVADDFKCLGRGLPWWSSG